MKPLLNINHLLCLIILLLSMNAFSQQYPQYGSEEWKKLSRSDKRQSLQIPEDRLKTMSTTDLIQAYLNFPLTPLIGAYDNSQKGFQRICNEFNGLVELLQRADVGSSLINFYKKMEPDKYNNTWDSVTKGKFTLNISYIELLISQEAVINKLKDEEVNILLKDLLLKMDLKNKHFKLHSGYGLEATALPIAKLIALKGTAKGYSRRLSNIPNMDKFISGGKIQLEKIPEIITIANDFLQGN